MHFDLIFADMLKARGGFDITFDGAQGADLALLIRRLKARVRTPVNHLACVGSSATLGSSDEAARKLIAYAEEIFGERFDQDAVIREDRIPAQEFLSDPDYLDMPDPAEITTALAGTMSLDQPAAALEIARCFFPELDPDHPDFDQTLSVDPGALDWRIALGRGLKEHVAVRRVLTIIAETKGPSTLASIREGLRKDDDDRYWRRALTYGVENNLQAVLDEYVHYLVDAEGLGARPSAERVAGVSKAISGALAIRPSQIEVEDPTVDGKKLIINKFQMRGRFAMRLADYKDEEGGAARLGSVRDAFNSPFRPFVLATTSVGQEGLDFHPYCYRVYHWNLPSNPVDLEQREGRVHRFKGHAIRLNLAWRQIDVVRGQDSISDDPWKMMFEAARAETENDTDLVPFWVYEGPVKVERRVPMLPYSREIHRLQWLKRTLTVYRLAFGQPRQEDLLEYLHSLLGTETAAEDLADLQIRLEP